MSFWGAIGGAVIGGIFASSNQSRAIGAQANLNKENREWQEEMYDRRRKDAREDANNPVTVGGQLGEDHRAYLDAAYPGTNAWERLGVNNSGYSGQAGQAIGNASDTAAAGMYQMRAQEANNMASLQAASIQADAQIASAALAGGVGVYSAYKKEKASNYAADQMRKTGIGSNKAAMKQAETNWKRVMEVEKPKVYQFLQTLKSQETLNYQSANRAESQSQESIERTEYIREQTKTWPEEAQAKINSLDNQSLNKFYELGEKMGFDAETVGAILLGAIGGFGASGIMKKGGKKAYDLFNEWMLSRKSKKVPPDMKTVKIKSPRPDYPY